MGDRSNAFVKQEPEPRGERFLATSFGITLSQCAFCRHKLPGAFCDAYPGGIPDAILLNEVDHREPWLGDEGVRFEERDEGLAARLDDLFT